MNLPVGSFTTMKSNAAAFTDVVEYLNYREFPRYRGKEKLPDTVFVEYDRIRAHYASFQLDSVFQPIFDFSKRSIVGHEGLLSSFSRGSVSMLGNVLAPERVFTLASNEDIIFLDRLARTLHTLNYLSQEAKGLLHLNVHPQHLLAITADHGRVFAGIIRRCGLEPPQIVLEITEHGIADKAALGDAIFSWQFKGYHIALDGFGREHAQIARCLKLKPDYLKFDRNFLLAGLKSKNRFRQLARITSICREEKVKVIGVGVENSEQLDLLRHLGINLAQGYLFGKPQPYCVRA